MEEPTLYQWFATSARQDPAAVALEVGDTYLTYGELEQRALAVAARILSGRRSAPARVALVASRTVSAYVGYLAIQRIGASVLPLNPEHPGHRNLDIAARAGVDVAVVDDTVANPFLAVPKRFRPVIVTVSDNTVSDDDDPSSAASRLTSVELPPVSDDTNSEAYVLFTSGTSGQPRGVPVRHRHISPYIAHNIHRFEIGPGCRLSQVFGLTFDASVGDLFMAWGSGATLVVLRRADLFRPVDFIVENRLTHWFSVPSVVRVAQSLGNLPLGQATSLRHSLFGAEAVTLKHALLWRAVAPCTDIYNLYGPTEAAINCTEYRLTGDHGTWTAATNGTLPIGTMYPGMEALIIDPEGRQADDGELCLRGRQRFDGYLDPGENVGRFVAFDGDGPAVPYTGSAPPTSLHWYRTGDRVSREGENLVHRGRLDQQVKIMGHRVEIGEVEAAIHRHPHVTDVAVIAIRADDDTQLIGVYAGSVVEAAEFDHWLRRELPLSMVPTRMEHLPALPLNDNGKIDRRRLTALLTGGVVADAAGMGARLS